VFRFAVLSKPVEESASLSFYRHGMGSLMEGRLQFMPSSIASESQNPDNIRRPRRTGLSQPDSNERCGIVLGGGTVNRLVLHLSAGLFHVLPSVLTDGVLAKSAKGCADGESSIAEAPVVAYIDSDASVIMVTLRWLW